MAEFKSPSNPRIELEDLNNLQIALGVESNDIARSISPGRMSLDSQDSCHTEDAAEKGYLNLLVRQAVRRSNSSVIAGMPVYPMTSNPRGMALIIDIRKYDNDVQDERYGSEVRLYLRTKLSSIIKFSLIMVMIIKIF